MSKEKLNDKISIEIYQQDWIPGFAAYKAGTLSKEAKAHVVLNLGALLGCVAVDEIDRKELPYIVAECLFHEVIHVLEEWAKAEFNEERVEKLIKKYQKEANNI